MCEDFFAILFVGAVFAPLLPPPLFESAAPGRPIPLVGHLLAERGAMSFPFPPGTGWVGLIERLESRRPKRAGEDADR